MHHTTLHDKAAYKIVDLYHNVNLLYDPFLFVSFPFSFSLSYVFAKSTCPMTTSSPAPALVHSANPTQCCWLLFFANLRYHLIAWA